MANDPQSRASRNPIDTGESDENSTAEVGDASAGEATSEIAEPPSLSRPGLHLLTLIVEGGLLLGALALGYFFAFHDPQQPLSSFLSWPWATSFLWGVLAAFPMLFLAIAVNRSKLNWCREFTRQIDELVAPLFKHCTLFELAWISICAGVGEEMMFRWCLQGGLTEVIPGSWSWLIALLVVSAVFGILHWLNRTYAVLTALIGIYLGGLMIVFETVLVPLIAHAAYDFMVLIWLVHLKKNEAS